MKGKQVGKNKSRLPEFPTERCSTHTGKVLDMYCEKDDIIGCGTCISKYHRLCPDSQIHSIPEMIDTLYNLSNSNKAHSHLGELLISMRTLGKSKDGQLAALNEARDEALQKITKFQLALEATVKKAAEMSKNEMMNAYTKLVQEILEDKSDCQKASETLHDASDKLDKAEGNRAQRFVCTKLAERKIATTENKIAEKRKRRNPDEQLSFTPNKALTDYINGLHGIGVVGETSKKGSDLYKIGESKDINIKHENDCNKCWSAGCCITYDNQLLVTDYRNKKLKRIDLKRLTEIDYYQLDKSPRAVCCISQHEAVVAYEYPNYVIHFISIGTKMLLSRQINLHHHCYGIIAKDDKLYVTDYRSSLYIHEMTGKLLKTISQDNAGNQLFYQSKHVTFNESGDRLYIGDTKKGIVCFDDEGNYLSTYNDGAMSNVDGVCADGRGNIFVVGRESHNVVQFSEDGKKIGVVLKQEDGLKYPRSVCFDKKLNRLFVVMEESNVVKMYELK
ncbi:hypothetical protein ACF0H5_010167 [Mactra antiquata]